MRVKALHESSGFKGQLMENFEKSATEYHRGEQPVNAFASSRLSAAARSEP